MKQIITDTCKCPCCGHEHTCQDIYTNYKLVPDDYTPSSGDLIRNTDGSFEIDFYDYKEFRKNSDIGLEREEKDLGDKPFYVRFLYDDSYTFCCPICGVIFDRAICSKVVVENENC